MCVRERERLTRVACLSRCLFLSLATFPCLIFLHPLVISLTHSPLPHTLSLARCFSLIPSVSLPQYVFLLTLVARVVSISLPRSLPPSLVVSLCLVATPAPALSLPGYAPPSLSGLSLCIVFLTRCVSLSCSYIRFPILPEPLPPLIPALSRSLSPPPLC